MNAAHEREFPDGTPHVLDFADEGPIRRSAGGGIAKAVGASYRQWTRALRGRSLIDEVPRPSGRALERFVRAASGIPRFPMQQLMEGSRQLPASTGGAHVGARGCRPEPAREQESIASFKRLVEDELEAILARGGGPQFAPPECDVLLRELWHTVRSGGKRVRPLFCFWGYRAAGGQDEDGIARPAAAIELLHTAALVEDDVFDRTRSRRGEDALHVRLQRSLGCAAHVAEALAILAANLGVVIADDLLLSSNFAPQRLLEAHRRFAAMRAEMVGGELLDVLMADFNESTARRTAQLKCASYTVTGPLLIGAALAGAPHGLLEGLEGYGRLVGEAFQLRDDLGGLDSREGVDVEAVADLRAGAHTFVTAAAFRRGDRRARALFKGAHGAARDPEVGEVRRALLNSGAVAETEALIARLVAEGGVKLRRLSIEADAMASLLGIAESLTCDPSSSNGKE